MLRQIICFLVAAAMCLGGAYILFDEAFIAHVLIIRMIAVGGFLTFIGGFWLWIDFGEPVWKRLTSRSE